MFYRSRTRHAVSEVACCVSTADVTDNPKTLLPFISVDETGMCIEYGVGEQCVVGSDQVCRGLHTREFVPPHVWMLCISLGCLPTNADWSTDSSRWTGLLELVKAEPDLNTLPRGLEVFSPFCLHAPNPVLTQRVNMDVIRALHRDFPDLLDRDVTSPDAFRRAFGIPASLCIVCGKRVLKGFSSTPLPTIAGSRKNVHAQVDQVNPRSAARGRAYQARRPQLGVGRAMYDVLWMVQNTLRLEDYLSPRSVREQGTLRHLGFTADTLLAVILHLGSRWSHHLFSVEESERMAEEMEADLQADPNWSGEGTPLCFYFEHDWAQHDRLPKGWALPREVMILRVNRDMTFTCQTRFHSLCPILPYTYLSLQ
ncbi:Zinc finger CCHC-type [Carpediemonas membranifera]|uniref:Zinc finger CCHC-type n=1 Tax=Carpediemonas membranifera TaxID=201153 RepID=A0A8J6B350_9EUKA|nr:Zinc finger CCHC-type [Carpediemonas membranifera]|eukprot:KAG9391967.1 Zinc finger CCHC-type [Carpediemonas membranifera]